ncbi:MAG: YtxH domain-containing protein [Chlorobi bacterium]|nr:YtxH domain-containing protein [Chlorobiota bacterium]
MADEGTGLSKGLLIGFFTGGLVGAALALLYAPKSGKELREDLRQSADKIIEDAEQYLDTAKKKATELINDGKAKSETLIAEAKTKANELLQDAEDILASAKKRVADEASTVQTAVKEGVEAYKEQRTSKAD